MSIIKENLIKILGERKSPIGEMIVLNIDIFDENELHQIYQIIHQTDIEKLKELFLYQNSQARNLLDRIINIAHELNHMQKYIENEINTRKENDLEEFIEQSLDLHYSIS